MDLMPELDPPVLFSVWKLQTACDPFVNCVWHGLDTPVTREEIRGDRTIPGTFSGSLEEVKKFTAEPPRRVHAC
jgi:hypothetical protein